jgi:hypothetical protein
LLVGLFAFFRRHVLLDLVDLELDPVGRESLVVPEGIGRVDFFRGWLFEEYAGTFPAEREGLESPDELGRF